MIGKAVVAPIDSRQLKFLDGLRGLAAFYVMVGHARWLLWEGYEAFKTHQESYNIGGKIMVYAFSIFKYGHEAVYFFFVLSGFVIHLRYSKQIVANSYEKFDFGNYLFRRIRRLYPPFLFSLLLTFIVDKAGKSYGLDIYSANTIYPLINSSIGNDLSIQALIGNVFFLQRVSVPVYGSNGPLWSLMYEWWFYMLYPIALWINRKNIKWSFLLVLLLTIICASLPELPLISTVLKFFFCWWLGALLGDFYTGRIEPVPVLLPWIAAGMLPLLFLTDQFIFLEFLADTLWGISFAGILYLLIAASKKGRYFGLLNSFKWLGDCSYTLYITHFPLLVFFSGILMRYRDGKLPSSQWFILAGIFLTLIFAYILHFIIERPFISPGRKRVVPIAVQMPVK